MIEGSGYIPLTNGSIFGSRKPKNLWAGGSGFGSGSCYHNTGFLFPKYDVEICVLDGSIETRESLTICYRTPWKTCR
jgi:hypothetical protein